MEINHDQHDSLREQNLNRLDGGSFDVFVVGGGINGAVSAASLAARGLSVGIVEKSDFASFTSQESSNLVWGGFKYLQNYELPLVYKLCRSRNKMMKAYPTNIAPLGFLATLDKSAPFPAWLAGLGSIGYWGIGALATERPRFYRPAAIKKREPLVDTSEADAGLEYTDAYLRENDARFVWSFVRTALDLGAAAANYVRLESATRFDSGWTLELVDEISGKTFTATARSLVNAAGPFVDNLNQQMGVTTKNRIVYSKGIHLVVPQLNTSERVLTFFDDTQRLFYVIPMAHRSVIGTTDTRTENVNEPLTEQDQTFLLDQINARLNLPQPLTTDDVISHRCGVRPLVVKNDGGTSHTEVDWTSLSRKHEMEIDVDRQLVSIFGGKLTDCLNVGDEVAEAVSDLGVAMSKHPKQWFGEPDEAERAAFYQEAKTVGLDRAPEIERADSVAEVLWRRHGQYASQLIPLIAADPSKGEPVTKESDVLRAELDLYREREMIVHLEDFLRRRTKLSLLFRANDLETDPGMEEICEALSITD